MAKENLLLNALPRSVYEKIATAQSHQVHAPRKRLLRAADSSSLNSQQAA